MRNQPGIRAFVLCATLCASLLLAPLALAAGRTSERGDENARVRTSEAISVQGATPGPVNLHRLLRNYLRLQFFRVMQEEPPVGSGYGVNGLSDDPDPTSNHEGEDTEDPNDDSGSNGDPDPTTEGDDTGYIGLH